ncbi:MAG: hypothetical protein ACI8UC_001624, partial [Psychromonas sp.]
TGSRLVDEVSIKLNPAIYVGYVLVQKSFGRDFCKPLLKISLNIAVSLTATLPLTIVIKSFASKVLIKSRIKQRMVILTVTNCYLWC